MASIMSKYRPHYNTAERCIDPSCDCFELFEILLRPGSPFLEASPTYSVETPLSNVQATVQSIG
jgi:hypothetical protein